MSRTYTQEGCKAVISDAQPGPRETAQPRGEAHMAARGWVPGAWSVPSHTSNFNHALLQTGWCYVQPSTLTVCCALGPGFKNKSACQRAPCRTNTTTTAKTKLPWVCSVVQGLEQVGLHYIRYSKKDKPICQLLKRFLKCA